MKLRRANRGLYSFLGLPQLKWIQKGSNFKINFAVQGWLFLGASLDRFVI